MARRVLIEGLNITAAIAAQKDLLLNFGGHPMAAGLSLEPEKLPEFTRRLCNTVADMLGDGGKERTLEIDGWLSLPEITLGLAKELEILAPYGPGNAKPTLATRALQLKSAVTIGRNQEHLKLMVADEAGNSQTVLWWNGAEEKDILPKGRFDLAYNLRASDWRGSLQVQMEFVDFRSLDVEKIEVKNRQFEIVDYRNKLELAQVLATLKQEQSTLFWAEGTEKKGIGGKDRYELLRADTLAIWTIPPSRDELRTALIKVNPRKIYLFAVTEPVEQPEAFIERLFGLLKYAVNHRAGKVSYPELETATAQRAVTVRTGVQWLVSQGKFKIIPEKEHAMVASVGDSQIDLSDASRLWAEIQSLLAETAAYRAHFKRADKEALFNS